MQHLLSEHVGGFELFEVKSFETLAQSSFNDYMALNQVVNHVSTLPTLDVADVASQIRQLEIGIISESLKNFLEINNVKVLHCDKSLKSALEKIGIAQKTSPNIQRGVKMNIHKITKKNLNNQLLLGVSHSIARENIKYDLAREDNIAIYTASEIEHIEQDIEKLNEKMMKLISWYIPGTNNDTVSFVFDLLNGQEVVEEPSTKEELVRKIKQDALNKIPADEFNILKEYLQQIMEKKKAFEELEAYLAEKMKVLAPNLRQILGDRLCCKMIHKAGGLTNLSLYPASTLQVLGAEKSLFKSLKMKTKTPKHGLLYEIEYLNGNIGRMCRYIATKCSLAARIDCFSTDRTDEYGKGLRKLIDKKMKQAKGKIETTGEVLEKVQKKLEASK
ncbi:hypothetical protein GINT2_001418 [Glugoides intestinalis]